MLQSSTLPAVLSARETMPGAAYEVSSGGTTDTYDDGSAIPADVKPGAFSGVRYADEWSSRPTDLGAIGADGRAVGDRLELLKKVAGDKFKAGNLTMACKMYTDAIRIAPQTHTLYSNRSACYAAAGEYIRAFEDACKCIDLMPTWPKVRAPSSTSVLPACVCRWPCSPRCVCVFSVLPGLRA